MPEAPESVPVPGDALLVLVLGGAAPAIHPGQLRYDRGRGLIVDLAERGSWRRGSRVVLAHVGPGGLRSRTGVVGELISPTRAYVVPSAPWKPSDRREHIRATVELDCDLAAGDAPSSGPLIRRPVELSASGFRWFGPLPVAVGDPVVLSLVPGTRSARRIDLRARVVRVGAPDGRHEVAGAFDSPSTAEVDALLAVVYRARLVALGASPGASDGGPIV